MLSHDFLTPRPSLPVGWAFYLTLGVLAVNEPLGVYPTVL